MIKPVAAALALLLALPWATPAAAAGPGAREQYERMCGNVLNFAARIVRKEQVAAIRPGTPVRLHPICTGVSLNDFGNAVGLYRSIGANPTLARALGRSGWRADDVVGIAIDGNGVDLYLHRG